MITTEQLRISVPSLPDIATLRAAQQAKKDQQGKVDLYPRDGNRALFELEKEVAEILGIRGGNLLLYNTGMSAVVDALEIIRPVAGTKILRGYQHYSQAGNYIDDELGSRGVNVLATDPGSTPNISMVLSKNRPDIVFLETVTNGTEMAVLDVEKFLRLPVLRDLDPVIILDNTLPTSTGIPLGEIMGRYSDRRIIGVESGTKFIGLNREMCGVAYTYDKDLLLRLRKRRQRVGSLLSISAVETIREVMPKTAAEYHLRNQQIFGHTLRLARACFASEEEEGIFGVVHPNLPIHPSHQDLNSRFPGGISPVFFIQPTARLEEGHYQLADALWQNPLISTLCDLGQSFGFDRVRIWPDDNCHSVRISGGIYQAEQEAELNQAFAQVLINFK